MKRRRQQARWLSVSVAIVIIAVAILGVALTGSAETCYEKYDRMIEDYNEEMRKLGREINSLENRLGPLHHARRIATEAAAGSIVSYNNSQAGLAAAIARYNAYRSQKCRYFWGGCIGKWATLAWAVTEIAAWEFAVGHTWAAWVAAEAAKTAACWAYDDVDSRWQVVNDSRNALHTSRALLIKARDNCVQNT
jgi:hypothetical protein